MERKFNFFKSRLFFLTCPPILTAISHINLIVKGHEPLGMWGILPSKREEEMKSIKARLYGASLIALIATSSMVVTVASTTAVKAQEITVGYFLEWPTPNQFAQVKKIYNEKLGVNVKWVSFDAGTAMSAAMAGGDVQISFSQGIGGRFGRSGSSGR